MPSKTGTVRSELSTAPGDQWSGLCPIQGGGVVWVCNSISSPVKLIFLKTESPFIQIYWCCAKSFTYVISLNLKPALWAVLPHPQFTEEETKDQKVHTGEWQAVRGFNPGGPNSTERLS